MGASTLAMPFAYEGCYGLAPGDLLTYGQAQSTATNTPTACAAFCLSFLPTTYFYMAVIGSDCYCAASGFGFATALLDDGACSTVCPGGGETTVYCGGSSTLLGATTLYASVFYTQ